MTLVAVFAAAALAIALLLVFVDDDAGGGQPTGRSARGVAAGFAAALASHSTSTARSLTCPSARDEVMGDLAHLMDDVTAASLSGRVRTSGRRASAALSITVHQRYAVPGPSGVQSREAAPTYPGHLGLARLQDGWCVSELDAAEPVY